MYIRELFIEVTRKCNIKCLHCLRGGAQNLNIDTKHIDSLLNQVSEIGHVTFTGGEPTLNVEAIQYFLDAIKKRGISLGGFYVVTNGKNVKENFVITMLKLYAYSYEKEICSVQVSNDIYHAEETKYNDDLLSGLSFFSKKNKDDNERYQFNLIDEGRAKKMRSQYKSEPLTSDIECVDDFDEAEIHLNAKGEIINGCNWSYVSQSKHKLCDVQNLREFYLKLNS